ncbi:uncharacterized protein RAG0_01610 [Rhynchosporium agropyri]|uniref:Post-SET domain-containing protein n=1 Tax=Rhynchosporium agropyri TaxID=914238 RepID=A0A1E1JXH0_9HELO|nr:uncharacterized protein RAG0_01610 [Rhynchosporium agropyri]
MAPLTPHWTQPSHPEIQEVILPSNPEDFTTKSRSKINVPPGAVYAKFDFPPCTKAERATYATVQMGKNEHLNLNSDLVYINHSCEPSVLFDLTPGVLSIRAGPKGLSPDDELTFFYPSTEWDMAQGFECFCGTRSCRGFISGAKNMSGAQLDGMWLNEHIKTLLAERDAPKSQVGSGTYLSNDPSSTSKSKTSFPNSTSPTTLSKSTSTDLTNSGPDSMTNGSVQQDGLNGGERRGVTSRELSGEMGGDTKRA